MEKKSVFGAGLDSVSTWEDMASDYVDRVNHSSYHSARLVMVNSLIPRELYSRGKVVFDFGCGDGVLLLPFLDAGAEAFGCDPSEEMIGYARKRFAERGTKPDGLLLGGVEQLAAQKTASLDAVLAFNVLAYLTDAEETEFYAQLKRAVRPGGYFAVTHSNELFDLFTANRYTVEFLAKHFVDDPATASRLGSLFTNPDKPQSQDRYNVRENPLVYPNKLDRLGFKVVKTGYHNWHKAPPVLKEQVTYPSTASVPSSEQWKLMFTCSTYGVCAQRANS